MTGNPIKDSSYKVMTTKMPLYAVIILTLITMALPATSQMPGRNTPLTDDDHQILELVGSVFGAAVAGIGSAHRYLLTDEDTAKNRFFSQMKQANTQILQLQNMLKLTRPNNRDLLQSLQPVITAQKSMDTGATTMLATLETTKKKNLSQEVAKLSNRVDHFAYTFKNFEQKLHNTLIFLYGTDNRSLTAASAATHLQWDTVKAISAATGYVLAGENYGKAMVQFKNALADFDTQVTRFRSSVDLTQPKNKPIAIALDTLAQKKDRFQATTRTLVKSMGPGKAMATTQLAQLNADIDALTAAIHDFIGRL